MRDPPDRAGAPPQRAEGYRRIRSWTAGVLDAARPICVEAGFQLVEEAPQRWSGADLVGSDYEMDL